MKTNSIIVTLFVSIVLISCGHQSEEQIFSSGDLRITYRPETGTATLSRNGILLLDQWQAAYVWQGDTIFSSDYKKHSFSSRPVSDELGEGTVYEITHKRKGIPDLTQRFFAYAGNDNLFIETELTSDTEIASNYMSPLKATVLGGEWQNQENKMLFVPFDNDCWVQYDVLPAGQGLSYETTAVFHPESRAGFVIGSIEHDRWKTGIRTSGKDGILDGLEIFGGVSSALTRDTLPHGEVKGLRVKSPKIMLGFFDDWRNGMEEFARTNSLIAPAPEWEQGTPFGWNSWGSIQTKINLNNAKEVSDFFKTELQPRHFENDGTVYIGLDSYWDNFSDTQLKEFADYCHANGQKAGIYWAPFVDWAKNPDRKVEGSPENRYKDIYLYAHGKQQELDGAWAVDPTHPATKRRIDHYIGRFKKAGFDYIKIDFLTHGAMEADSHYDPNVTTGIQAYNEGMRYLNETINGQFYITMAISPLFPSNYAHSRRIACDAFAGMSDTEYTLNGLSYGWWLGNAYRYNDPDHLVLQQKNETEGENRARLTSGVITGIYMLGDDLSAAGSSSAKQRVQNLATNAAVADIARIGKSFRPVYGYKPSEKKRAESLFMLEQDECMYLAAFNFTDRPQSLAIPARLLNLNDEKEERGYTELWSGRKGKIGNDTLHINVPGKDVALLKIDR